MRAWQEIDRLRRIPGEEPIFILRAQDKLAADVVRYWADRAEAEDVTSRKVREARDWATEMERWPKHKLPD
jgi:hypothetical protein